MAALQRLRCTWTGFAGAPGISTFYSLDASQQKTSLVALFEAVKGSLPADVTINVAGSGDVLDDATGLITSSWTSGVDIAKQGTDPGAYSAPAGYEIVWTTSGIVNGHRVRGRTFMVPCAASMFDVDGTLLLSNAEFVRSGVTSFYGSEATNTRIWSRPRLAFGAWTDQRGKVHKAQAARDGSSFAITSGVVPDKSVVLRSRRD